jgi:hypothetical protein
MRLVALPHLLRPIPHHYSGQTGALGQIEPLIFPILKTLATKSLTAE